MHKLGHDIRKRENYTQYQDQATEGELLQIQQLRVTGSSSNNLKTADWQPYQLLEESVLYQLFTKCPFALFLLKCPQMENISQIEPVSLYIIH